MKLNQKLTKSIIRTRLIQAIYTREQYLCKNLGIKVGGGCLPEGGVFSGTYSIFICHLANYLKYVVLSHEVYRYHDHD